MNYLLIAITLYITYLGYKSLRPQKPPKETIIWSPHLDDDGEWIVTIT